MFSVGKITKYWLILLKIEVKKTILFDPMTGKKVNKRANFEKILFCKRKFIKFSNKIHRKENYISHKQQATEVPFHLKKSMNNKFNNMLECIQV
jgi:hypothetical protein